MVYAVRKDFTSGCLVHGEGGERPRELGQSNVHVGITEYLAEHTCGPQSSSGSEPLGKAWTG